MISIIIVSLQDNIKETQNKMKQRGNLIEKQKKKKRKYVKRKSIKILKLKNNVNQKIKKKPDLKWSCY